MENKFRNRVLVYVFMSILWALYHLPELLNPPIVIPFPKVTLVFIGFELFIILIIIDVILYKLLVRKNKRLEVRL